MSKIRLNVLGISYSQTQSGAYALVLNEETGERRIPIIIGGFEAQSIAIQLEGLKPPRPLTHDLFLNFATAFNISLEEIIIYKLEEGVFFSKLVFNASQDKITIDARTSDAIALAIRFKCPIYTTNEIISKAGIVMDIETKESNYKEQPVKDPDQGKRSKFSEELKRYDINELHELLNEAINDENYEKASEIRDEINRRNKN